jgi:hypothetical protein
MAEAIPRVMQTHQVCQPMPRKAFGLLCQITAGVASSQRLREMYRLEFTSPIDIVYVMCGQQRVAQFRVEQIWHHWLRVLAMRSVA